MKFVFFLLLTKKDKRNNTFISYFCSNFLKKATDSSVKLNFFNNFALLK